MDHQVRRDLPRCPVGHGLHLFETTGPPFTLFSGLSHPIDGNWLYRHGHVFTDSCQLFVLYGAYSYFDLRIYLFKVAIYLEHAGGVADRLYLHCPGGLEGRNSSPHFHQ